jgi:hypothetical protein
MVFLCPTSRFTHGFDLHQLTSPFVFEGKSNLKALPRDFRPSGLLRHPSGHRIAVGPFAWTLAIPTADVKAAVLRYRDPSNPHANRLGR